MKSILTLGIGLSIIGSFVDVVLRHYRLGDAILFASDAFLVYYAYTAFIEYCKWLIATNDL